MRHLNARLLLAIAFAALTACGQMGPLYMPQEHPPATPPAAAEPVAGRQQADG